MILFFLILLIITTVGLRKADGKERDYMSIAMTNSIKGFFLVMVFFSHIWTYANFGDPRFDQPYLILRKLGQCIVVMFLFYSGYGIMESVKKKGQDYISQLPVKRFLKVLLQFDSAIMLFWLYRYTTGTRYDTKKMLLTFVGWDGIGNSNWYIFATLWLYVFTFISFLVFRKSHLKAAVGVLILSVFYMIVMYRTGRGNWWYDTVLCYFWGMMYSLYRPRIEGLINETFGTWLFFLSAFILGYLLIYLIGKGNPILYQIWIFCFFAAIVTFTMRFVVDSRPLQWLGRNLFELYILQRIPMLVLRPYMLSGEVTSTMRYLYVIACFLATLLIAVIYRETIGKIITKFIIWLNSVTEKYITNLLKS